MKCGLCGTEITERDSHNGQPLIEGRVCNNCNWKVIRERLRRLNQTSTESVAVVGAEAEELTKDPIKDFENYAKKFEETFVLGKTPVRKEKAENKTKVSNGQVVGEVDSMAKEEKVEQVEPVKSATESYAEARPHTQRILDKLDADVIDPLNLAIELLEWMSDDEVEEFGKSYGYLEEMEGDEE